jgi:hypothetical protein
MASYLPIQSWATGPSEASAHGGVHEKCKDLQHVENTGANKTHSYYRDASGNAKTIDVVPATGLAMCSQQARTTVPTIGTEVEPAQGPTVRLWHEGSLDSGRTLSWTAARTLRGVFCRTQARFRCRTLARKEARKEARKDGPSFLPSQMAN